MTSLALVMPPFPVPDCGHILQSSRNRLPPSMQGDFVGFSSFQALHSWAVHGRRRQARGCKTWWLAWVGLGWPGPHEDDGFPCVAIPRFGREESSCPRGHEVLAARAADHLALAVLALADALGPGNEAGVGPSRGASRVRDVEGGASARR